MLGCDADFANGLLTRQAKLELPGSTWMKQIEPGPVQGCDAQASTTARRNASTIVVSLALLCLKKGFLDTCTGIVCVDFKEKEQVGNYA